MKCGVDGKCNLCTFYKLFIVFKLHVIVITNLWKKEVAFIFFKDGFFENMIYNLFILYLFIDVFSIVPYFEIFFK